MRDRPHHNHRLEWPGGVVPEWARPQSKQQKRHGKGRGGPRGGAGGGKRERLQKVMAQSGYGSRRNIEILIAQGHITINGQVAKLGDSVGPGDKVKLDGNVIQLRFGADVPRVLLYHKPEGEIVTRDDPEKRPTVFDRLPKVHGGRWVSVGRLDLNTGGLLIFTTSGELANRLTHPRFEVEREYAVRVLGSLTDENKANLLVDGVEIEGERCKFDSIEDRGGEGANHWYHVVLREGKNREVRRMVEAIGLTVSRLMRVRFGEVELPGFLKRGMMREMDEAQVQDLLTFAGMNEPPPAAAPAAEEEEDEHDNIGNRWDSAPRQTERSEPDDDFGNRAHPGEREIDGNRGAYVPEGAPRQQRPQKQRRHGGGKGLSFKKRGQGGQGQGQGQQNPQQRRQGHGNVAEGQPQGHGQGQGQAHGQQGHPQGQGHGKPGRRRKHRNRNRNAQGQQQPPRGDQQPQNNGNRDPH